MTHEQTAATLASLERRIDDLLAQLTLEEKAALTVGRDAWTTQPIERLGIPSIWLSDGPTGVRKAQSGTDMSLGHNIPATCFPTESALGSSWDTELVGDVAGAIAAEAQAAGVQVLLGPGVNLKRSPLCGRNFEYFSEDPILTGNMAAAFTTGLQERGVGVSIKHLVANESETDRMITDSLVDERTLRELYLRPFEIAVTTARPWTLMASYNQLNGSYCVESSRLLRDIVVGEWGFDGIIVSDWGAVNDRVASVAAGLHLQMPTAPTVESVVAAVHRGSLTEAQLDAVIRPLLALIFKADAARQPCTTVDLEAHHRLARRAASESIVLLKNENGLLPLDGTSLSELALIGIFARAPRYQGAGSSQVVPARPVETIHDELIRMIGTTGRVTYAPGYAEDGTTNADLIQQAQAVAQRSSVAVVVVGLPGSYEEEGADRTHLDLPVGHNMLVDAILDVQPRTIVVLTNGSAVAMPWAIRVPALVEGWLGGQASGGAIAGVLLGRVNPSGKLAETFPVRLEDTPAYLNFPDDGLGRVPFSEGLFTGYRWYDARRIVPLFPFGHGLSYTSFAYSDLIIEKPDEAQPDSHEVVVSVKIRNTGQREGKEVVQLYVREQLPRLQRPEKELKAFAKVWLGAGAEKVVRFPLSERDFAIYDPRLQEWVVSSSAFDILVGASSRDIREQATVTVTPTQTALIPPGRLSPLRDWLAHPATRERLRPIISALFRGFFGTEVELPTDGTTGNSLVVSFITSMPIVKLVMFGALTEAELASLIDIANKPTDQPLA